MSKFSLFILTVASAALASCVSITETKSHGPMASAHISQDAKNQGLETIIGVWKQVQQEYPGSGFPVITNPHPSLMIFTPGYYSYSYTGHPRPMRENAIHWQASDEEKLRRHGEIVFNSGSYKIEDGKLILSPIMARVPELMGGGKIIYDVTFKEGQMILKLLDEMSYDGTRSGLIERGGTNIFTYERLEEA